MRRFFGKYRGKVVNTIDPLALGRIQVVVPAIFGSDRLAWAMPCSPYAGNDIGFFAIPPLGTNVWVEFEAGVPDYPIWTGCFWGTSQLPKEVSLPTPDRVQVFKTDCITIVMNNLPGAGGMTIEVNPPAVAQPLKMVFNSNGIELNHNNLVTINLKANEIELKTGETSKMTIALNQIELSEGAAKVTMQPTQMDLAVPPAKLGLSSASGIELECPPGTTKISPTGVEISAAAASLKVNPASIDLSNTAASIKLSPVSVNVNNGALEVI